MNPVRRAHAVLARISIFALFAGRFITASAATFEGLGDLPGGTVEGYAIGVSADGQVVAGHSISSSGDEAFLWKAATGMVGLGDLTGGGFSSFTTMASNGGSVAVGYGTVFGGTRPFRWTSGGGMASLGDLPGGGSNGFATGMSGDGTVVCGQSTSASGTEAFRWTAAGGMVGMGDLGGGAFDSSAWAVSADGTAIAGDGTTAAGRQAFLWTPAGGVVPLGFLPGGGAFSGAHGVADGGAFVAGASDSSSAGAGQVEAYRWSPATGMVGLGDLPGGVFGSFANGISADGQTVVGGSETDAGTEAYFWTPQCGMRNLKSHLLSLGVAAVASWTLRNAHGVSADGLTIVGYGVNPSGRTEPWIARIPACVGGAGAVPDGHSVPGIPLVLGKEAGGAVRLTWSPSCGAGDDDYGVYEGTIGDFTSHTGRICSTAGAVTAAFVPAEGDRYYLVVPNNGMVEGSYGTGSDSVPRPAAPAACLPQSAASCP